MTDSRLKGRQVLVMMVGVPGSGKSFFARQLAESLGFKRFSTDAIRTELYGRPDEQFFREGTNNEVFKVLNGRAAEALAAGRSVIRDHMHHGLHWREFGRHQAAAVGAIPVVIWIKTPHDVAHHRGLNRELTEDQRVESCPQRMRRVIDKFHRSFSPILEGEICLEIDGQLEFEKQLEQFVDFCQQIRGA